MKVTRFNIAKPTKYTKDNEEKTRWDTVGTYTVIEKEDGKVSRLVSIPAIGLEAQVFEQTDRNEKKGDNY